MTIVCAFDEGPGIGLGHRRRVESLVAALHAIGAPAELRVLGGDTVEGDVVVVDSYQLRADDPERVRAGAVVAIDDLERDLAVDLVVDPDPAADPAVHTRAGRVVAGVEYAFVSPGLHECTPAPLTATVGRILVATGGADADGVGARFAGELATRLPHTHVRQVAGPWGRASDDPRVEVVRAPDGLGPELAAADLVVTAAGVTMLEACFLGRPTVAFAIVPGQDRELDGAVALGAVLAATPATAAEVTAQLASDHAGRVALASRAREVVDGQGAARVAALVAGMSRHGVHAR